RAWRVLDLRGARDRPGRARLVERPGLPRRARVQRSADLVGPLDGQAGARARTGTGGRGGRRGPGGRGRAPGGLAEMTGPVDDVVARNGDAPTEAEEGPSLAVDLEGVVFPTPILAAS